MFHVFVECPRPGRVLHFTEGLTRQLGERYCLENVIFGPKYSSLRRPVATLVNFVYGTVKLSVWKTRRNQIQGMGSVDPLLMAKGIISARLKIEHTYYSLVGDMERFAQVWCVGDALCAVTDNGTVQFT